jgi:hypothetical protein
MHEKELIALYRRMKAWVARERRRLERTGERPTQRYLRRSRLLIDVDAITFRELVRELVAMSVRRPRR